MSTARKWYEKPGYSVFAIMLPVLIFIVLILVFHIGYPDASNAKAHPTTEPMLRNFP